jgi:hypothetical protein
MRQLLLACSVYVVAVSAWATSAPIPKQAYCDLIDESWLRSIGAKPKLDGVVNNLPVYNYGETTLCFLAAGAFDGKRWGVPPESYTAYFHGYEVRSKRRVLLLIEALELKVE